LKKSGKSKEINPQKASDRSIKPAKTIETNQDNKREKVAAMRLNNQINL